MKTTRTVSHKRLRTLGLRAIRIAPRVGQLHEGLAELSTPLVAAAQAFVSAYDTARAFESQQGAEMSQGRAALQELYTRLRIWIGALQRDVPGFESVGLEGSVDAPDLLLADAQRVLEVVNAQGGALAYAEALVKQISSAVERVETEWADAREAVVKLQELRDVARAHAVELHQQLIVYRRALKVVVGSRHEDYQNLRTSRAAADIDEQDEQVEADQPEAEFEQPVVEAGNVTSPTPTNGHAITA